MEKTKATEKLFKNVYGSLIDKDNQELEEKEIVRIALQAIWQFAENEGVKIKEVI
jgi:hypothetical protein